MHTLMPAILLWMTGLDALEGEAQTQPPHRKLGEVEQRVGRGERHAIVGTDADGQAALLKQARKGRKCKGFAGRFQSLTEEEKARGVIGDGIVPFRWVPGAMEFAAMPSPVSSIARRDAFRDAFVMSARQVTFLDTLLSALTPFLCSLPFTRRQFGGPQKINSFAIKQILPLLAGHPGWGVHPVFFSSLVTRHFPGPEGLKNSIVTKQSLD
jgi:hypothetical protein